MRARQDLLVTVVPKRFGGHAAEAMEALRRLFESAENAQRAVKRVLACGSRNEFLAMV